MPNVEFSRREWEIKSWQGDPVYFAAAAGRSTGETPSVQLDALTREQSLL